MPRGRTQHPTPDLFSEASPASQVSSPQAAAVDMAASLRRYLLPKDLPNALKRLDDGELASLLAAALEEAKRHGKLPPSHCPPNRDGVPMQRCTVHKHRNLLADAPER